MTKMTTVPKLVTTVLAAAIGVGLVGAGGASAQTTPTMQPASGGAVRTERDVVWRTVDGEQLTLDAYLPARAASHRPAVVLIHGGGWRQGDKANLAEQGRQLAAIGYAAFSINYRLAPAHPYPAAVDDVQAAVKWLREPEQVKHYGLDPERIGALGGSAGAHLTGMLATLGKGSLDKGARIRAGVSWSGPMDFTASRFDPATLTPEQKQRIGAKGSVAQFLGCNPLDDSCHDTAVAASPISHVDRTDAPLLLANSDHELVPLDQAQVMNDALEHAGVPRQLIVLPGHRHARVYAADVWDQTVAFFEQYLGHPKP